jgi:hypothetical protein
MTEPVKFSMSGPQFCITPQPTLYLALQGFQNSCQILGRLGKRLAMI